MVEKFPKVNKVENPNTIVNGVIKGTGNYVSDSARNVVCFGTNNHVGHGCSNITILGSSGCVVLEGVTGVTLINTSGVIASTNSTTYFNGSLLPAVIYKKYVALLSQAGTADPTAIILENTFDSAPVWTRSSAGSYSGQIIGAFTIGKTATLCQANSTLAANYKLNAWSNFDADTIYINSRDAAGVVADSIMTDWLIQIVVYS